MKLHFRQMKGAPCDTNHKPAFLKFLSYRVGAKDRWIDEFVLDFKMRCCP